jgi:uncharacterized protein (DUF1015 family)
MKVKPFRGIRPPKALVEQVQSRPYDVLSSQEARQEADGNEKSLYHIIKPEIDFPAGTGEYEPKVYEKAHENFLKFIANGWLKQDERELFYIYAQTMNGKSQYGIVVCASVEDYLNGKIKKHELTRKDKEEDRMKHVRVNNANIEPVFLAFRYNKQLSDIIAMYSTTVQPEYIFTADDGIIHTFWIVENNLDIITITNAFADIPELYIADGHHRSAAAALVGAEKAALKPNPTGNEEFNFYMAVCFDEAQLTILPYNRVIKDLNSLSIEDVLNKIAVHFDIVNINSELYQPLAEHEMALYINGEWKSLKLKQGLIDENDPIASLDVSISSRFILDYVFGIKDLRTDNRIDFVGGIRGVNELKHLVDSGEWAVALALFPVTMRKVMQIADAGAIMPPKATWFEPKLRSGLVIHSIE